MVLINDLDSVELIIFYICFLYRIQNLCNVTFYMSPSPLAEYERITINITVPPECEKNSELPASSYVLGQWYVSNRGRWQMEYIPVLIKLLIYSKLNCSQESRVVKKFKQRSRFFCFKNKTVKKLFCTYMYFMILWIALYE